MIGNDCDAVEVVDVASGSVAATSGLQPDDLIVALNGRITASVDDVHRLLALFPSDVPLVITLLRDGQMLEVEVARS